MGVRQVRFWTVCLTFASVTAGCTTGGGVSAARARVDEVQRRTTQGGAVATPVAEIERSASGVRYAWDVRAQRDWTEYRTKMVDAFKADFRVVRSDATVLLLSRSAHGDTYRLEFQLISGPRIIEVHVVFSAIAD